MQVFENRVIFFTDWNSLVGCVRPTRLTLLSHIIANRLAQKMEGRPNKNVRLCTYTGLYMCVSTEPGMKCPGLFYDGPKKSRWVEKLSLVKVDPVVWHYNWHPAKWQKNSNTI